MRNHFHSLQGISDGKFREARRLRREMTDSERLLWSRLRGNQIEELHFRRQHVINGFIVDFYCKRVKLVIEVDGGIHQGQVEKDGIRDRILQAEGILVLRIPNEKINNEIESIVKEIILICRSRANDSSPKNK